MRKVDVLYLVEHTAREMDVACAVKVLAEDRHGLSVEIRNIYLHAHQSLREFDPLVVAHPFFYFAAGALAVEDYVARWPDALHFNLAWEQLHYKAHWQIKRPSDEFARTKVVHHAWGRFYEDYLTGFGVPSENIRVNGQPAYQLYRDPYRRHYRTRESLAALYGLDPAKRWVFVPENYRWAFIGGKVKLFSRLGGDADEIAQLRDFSRHSLKLLLECCNELARRPDVEVVFRTRPAVNSEVMFDFFSEQVGTAAPRLHFIKEGSVREWVLAADTVVSSYSTSLIEAAVAGKDLFMFEPVAFPCGLHCAWYDLAPKIADPARFVSACLEGGGQGGASPLHRWAETELMSGGDAIANLAGLLAEMRDMARVRRGSPKGHGPLPLETKIFFNAQTHEADVFQPSDVDSWVAAWRGSLAGAHAPQPSTKPEFNRLMRAEDLLDESWDGLAAVFPPLAEYRVAHWAQSGQEAQAAPLSGLWRRLGKNLVRAASVGAAGAQPVPPRDLWAVCSVLAALGPQLRSGTRLLALGECDELLRKHFGALGVEMVTESLGSSEQNLRAAHKDETVLDHPAGGFDVACSIFGLERLDVAAKHSLLAGVAHCLKPGGIFALSFACLDFDLSVLGQPGFAGVRNAIRNVADIRRHFLACGEFEVLGNEAFATRAGRSPMDQATAGVLVLRRKGAGQAGEGKDAKAANGGKGAGHKVKVPKHWSVNSWEEKARENPLYAVMTMEEMADAGPDNFSEQHLALFFEKGRKLAEKWVLPSLAHAPEKGLVLEYGCGAGRILKALVDRGIACGGIDISQTMLEHCRRLVPGVARLACLSPVGDAVLEDGCARIVYSYAVVQHIDRLSAFDKAVSEMCRLLAPGGILVLQVNCEDYTLAAGGVLGRTENHEDHSVHYPPGSSRGSVHRNSTWSGVYIGHDRLCALLRQGGVAVDRVVPFNDKKPRAQVYFGTKDG
ncbi:surface carbohydrate biosynthesis protein [Humidesulfovibrio mexicanus]|uniref:Surface carbohydrate biosynthesis protein n=1 Tax=Humidesulfovibrio mexicanus TaxID=147047 RepID=A0A238Y6X0_9BACT|nr:methyltransferase domain-containing protein [Humidesulfovibrio mexicanus]SNR66702.1 surface carbohydrate biosynthesis protein [Humidesulfovibrio mexicanus]